MEALCESSSLGACDADVVALDAGAGAGRGSSSSSSLSSAAASAQQQQQQQQTEPSSLAVVTAKNFVSGIVGGGCEAVVGYPLETIKARMQTGSGARGPVDTLRQSVREGGVGSLYRGASPQILRSAISASVLFGLMGQYRHFYATYLFEDKPRSALVAAATSTGFTESLLYTPFEVVKVRMQTQHAHARSRITNWQCVQRVYAQSGLRGLYRGLVPFAQREMLGNTAYFMAYESAKQLLLDEFVHGAPPNSLSPEQQRVRTYQAIAAAGGYAGFMYWLVVFPVDTVKSVMQADRLDRPRYRGVVDCAAQLYREGGVPRFFRGISPSLVRAFPANAITFVAFETCLSVLNQHF